jgi:hypothetical protein
MRHPFLLVAPLLLLTTIALEVVNAQLLTIPEELRHAGVSLASGPSIPSGKAPSVDAVLADADTIVVGTVGPAAPSYLSDDQREVLTDYQVVDPVLLFQSSTDLSIDPGRGQAIVVTILGGTISMLDLTYERRHAALPSLKVGARCLFLLKRAGAKYVVAGRYYGVFEIGDTLVPLMRDAGYGEELRPLPAAAAINSLVTRRR